MKKPAAPKKAAKPAPQHGHAKAPQHKPQHVPASQRIARHKAAQKAARTRAKNAKKATHHKRRGLAVTDGVACCAAQALAASLRLAGRPVSDEDVLALHWLAGGDEDAGTTISATLKAASWHGLAGVRPVAIRNVDSAPVPGSIIGVTLPGGPHTVTLDPSGQVWSWGELHDPAELGAGPVEEAWLVDWEV